MKKILKSLLRPWVPPLWLQRFSDWTVRVCTVYEPDRLDQKYDYWWSGFTTAVILLALLGIFFQLI